MNREILKKYPYVYPRHSSTIENMPVKAFGKIVIVSMMVAEYIVANNCFWVFDALNIVTPDTSPAGVIRDDNGVIIGTKGLIAYC